MHAASSQRCAAVVEPTRTGAASTQRCPAAAAHGEAPRRRCDPASKPIESTQPKSTPGFPAVVRGNHERVLQVELHSGSPVNLIKESIAEAFGFDIVVDDFGYHDYIDADESFVLPPDIVGLTCFTLFHDGYELWYDGFVVADHVLALKEHADVFVGAPFMEQNDVSVRPSKQEIMFGDDYIFSYSGSGSGRSVCGMVTGHEPIELDTECEHHEPVPDCDLIAMVLMAGEHKREQDIYVECAVHEDDRCDEYGESEFCQMEMSKDNDQCEHDELTVCELDVKGVASKLNDMTMYDLVKETTCEHNEVTAHELVDESSCEHVQMTVCEHEMIGSEHNEMTECDHEMEIVCEPSLMIESEHKREKECCAVNLGLQCEISSCEDSYCDVFSGFYGESTSDNEVYDQKHVGSGVESDQDSTVIIHGCDPSPVVGRDPDCVAMSPWTEHSSGHISVELDSGFPPPDQHLGIPITEHSSNSSCTERYSDCSNSGDLIPPNTERGCGALTEDCGFIAEPSPAVGDVIWRYPDFESDSYSTELKCHAGIGFPPTGISCHGNAHLTSICAERHQVHRPAITLHQTSVPPANATSNCNEGALPCVSEAHFHSSRLHRMTSDDSHRNSETCCPIAVLHPIPLCPDASFGAVMMSAYPCKFWDNGLQGAQLSTDTSIPDPQPPSFHAGESSAADDLPSETDRMLIICVVDDYRQQTPYADHDKPGHHPFLDGAGHACCDRSPTWIPSPWTCGPRPQNFYSYELFVPRACARDHSPRRSNIKKQDIITMQNNRCIGPIHAVAEWTKRCTTVTRRGFETHSWHFW